MMDLESRIKTFFEKNYQDVPDTNSICEIIKRTGSDNLTLFFSTNENAEYIDKNFDLKKYYKLYKDCSAAKIKTHDIKSLLLNQNIIYYLIWKLNKDKASELEKLISINNSDSILKTEINSTRELAEIEFYAGDSCNDYNKKIIYNLKGIQHLLNVSQINEEYKEFFIPNLEYLGHSFHEIGNSTIALIDKEGGLEYLQKIDGISKLYSILKFENIGPKFRPSLKTENTAYLKKLKNILNVENQPVENLTKEGVYKHGLDCLRLAANFFIQESERNQLYSYQQLFNICCELNSFKNQDEDLNKLAEIYQERILDKIFCQFSKKYNESEKKSLRELENDFTELIIKVSRFLNLKKELILLKNKGIDKLIEELQDPNQNYLLGYIGYKVNEYLKQNKDKISKDNILYGINKSLGIDFNKVEPLLFTKAQNPIDELSEHSSNLINIYLALTEITKKEDYADRIIELTDGFLKVENRNKTKDYLNRGRAYVSKAKIKNNDLELIGMAFESLKYTKADSCIDIFTRREMTYLVSIEVSSKIKSLITSPQQVDFLDIEENCKHKASIYRLPENRVFIITNYNPNQNEKEKQLIAIVQNKIQKQVIGRNKFVMINWYNWAKVYSLI